MLPWTLVMDECLYDRLTAHLFPGDDDEHGAVIAAGIAETSRGTRLLARDLVLARDGTDFVPGRWGYRMLTPRFVSDNIRGCRDDNLVYLAVHNHGGHDRVGFSEPDNRSHERGYPALLDISGGPVGALVFARNAVAGDIWTPDRSRRPIGEAVIVGRNIRRLYPEPPPKPPKADATFDRQARWFGDSGQHLLGRLKVGVIGAGGVGTPLIAQLARIGVGTIVVIDPERVELTNLPRLPESRRLDAMMSLRHGEALSRLADRLSTPKVRLAKRIVKRANRKAAVVSFRTSVIDPEAAAALTDCDFIFLAADQHLARMLFNAITHQYLIPGVQLGTRIDVNPTTGDVADIRSNLRLVLPRQGCLRCNRLIDPHKIQDEAIGTVEREQNRYVDEVPAPSVITFNTRLAAEAATDFMLMLSGLIDNAAPLDYLRHRPRLRRHEPVVGVPNRLDCKDCGIVTGSRRARGDRRKLPLPETA
jgi:molybdopterin/thiamine biosynthesis adenylyltransferase